MSEEFASHEAEEEQQMGREGSEPLGHFEPIWPQPSAYSFLMIRTAFMLAQIGPLPHYLQLSSFLRWTGVQE